MGEEGNCYWHKLAAPAQEQRAEQRQGGQSCEAETPRKFCIPPSSISHWGKQKAPAHNAVHQQSSLSSLFITSTTFHTPPTCCLSLKDFLGKWDAAGFIQISIEHLSLAKLEKTGFSRTLTWVKVSAAPEGHSTRRKEIIDGETK